MNHEIKQFESLFDIENQSVELQELKNSLNNLYTIFNTYLKPSNLTCLDHGATQEEILIFNSNNLKDLPCEFIQKLEFYDYTYQSWGNESEVKYLLPRTLECMALLFVNQTDKHINTSITYKLLNPENWLSEELIIIEEFVKRLFNYYIKYGNLKLINSAFDLFIACHIEPQYMINKIKEENNREELILSLFQVWIKVDMQNYIIDNYYLTVGGVKEKLIKNILNDNEFLVQIEFLFMSPWDDLLIKGLRKDDNIFGIEEEFGLIKKIKNRRVMVDEYLRTHNISMCSCPSCGFPTITERMNYEICSICNWEDDGQDDGDAEQVRGANNNLSLTANRLLIEKTLKDLSVLLEGTIVSDPEEMINLIKIRDKDLNIVMEKFNYTVEFNNPIWDEFKRVQKKTLSIFVKK